MVGTLCHTFVVLSLLLWKGVESLTDIPLADGSVSENVNLDLIEESTNYGDSKWRTPHVFPERIGIRITKGDDQLTLNLTRNPMIKHDIPITVERNGTIVYQRVEQQEMTSFYQDKGSSASFIVTKTTTTTHVTDQHGGYRFTGMLHYVNETFMVQTISRDSHVYKLTPVPVDHAHFDYVKSMGKDHAVNQTDNGGRTRRGSRGQDYYEVEVLAVADYSVYNFWFHHSTVGSFIEKDDEAKNNIRHYYALIINAVDLRYQTIDDMDYTIRVLLTGIHIADRQSASPWTEKNRITEIDDRVDGDKSLEDFRNWWKKQDSVLQKHDHAMLFTKLNLTAEDEDTGKEVIILGASTVEGICTNRRQSIIEDGQGETPITAAHELGHNLGAEHDDSDDNSCHGYNGYIMTATAVSLKRPVWFLQRQWIFSGCSKLYFQYNIRNMNRVGMNCLIARSGHNIIDQVDHELPGQIYGPDVQCQSAVGEKSYFTRSTMTGGADFSDICTKMLCHVPGEYGYARIIMALEGTTCGPRKVCKFGACVATNSTAVSSNGGCLFGDTRGQVPGTTGTCEEEISGPEYAYKCYNSDFRQWCCTACQRYYTKYPNITGCEYGDHAVNCYRSHCDTYLLTGQNALDCCYTCSDAYRISTTTAATNTEPARTTTTTTHVPPPQIVPHYQPTVGTCIQSCQNLMDGNYQSCQDCNVFATCYRGTLYDNRPCPRGSYWTDDKKRCEQTSTTCLVKEKVWKSTERPVTTTDPSLTTPPVGTCIRSCKGIRDGDYQSCLGCGVYVTCFRQYTYDKRACPYGLVWTDDNSRCEHSSRTCKSTEKVWETTQRLVITTEDPSPKTPPIGTCIQSCQNLMDGNYQSCQDCNVFASCYRGTLYDNRPCPRGSYWTDDKKRCEQTSTTCLVKEKVWKSTERPVTTTDPSLTTPPVGTCIRSCKGIRDGDYQSCLGCGVYVTCFRQYTYDKRACPYGLVWTDDNRRCEHNSRTCKSTEKVWETTQRPVITTEDPSPKTPPIGTCIRSCKGIRDGDYQSCLGCGVYVTCFRQYTYDKRACPYGLVWTDDNSRCEHSSRTCKSTEKVWETTQRLVIITEDPSPKTPPIGTCIQSCQNLMDGNYQSCQECNVFASCYRGTLYDNRPCPRGSYWTDDKKRCEQTSTTCLVKEKVWKSTERPVTTTDPSLTTPPVGTCIRSCKGIRDGDYQSCLGCGVYVTCFRQYTYDKRACPYGLVWTDDNRRCEHSSRTC